MSNFISWIEKGAGVYYLDENSLNSAKGKAVFGKLDRSILDYSGIRKYFELGEKEGVEFENSSFWNEKIPTEITASWNNGKLDCMLNYLKFDDINYLISSAPNGFSEWVIKKKYSTIDNFFEDLKKDQRWLNKNDWLNRFTGYYFTNDIEGMKTDNHHVNRFFGHYFSGDISSINKDKSTKPIYESLKNGSLTDENNNWVNRFIYYIVKGMYSKMESDTEEIQTFSKINKLRLTDFSKVRRPVLI